MKVTHVSKSTKATIAWPTALTVEKVNAPLLAQVVKGYLSNLRQGTSATKTRSDINRTKKKWFKQKGTGNARHGARTANIFVGGGVSHGPTGEQNWKVATPRTLKRQALVHAFNAQAKQLVVHDGVEQVNGKTKSAVAVLAECSTPEQRVLVITSSNTPEVIRSYNNLANVLVMNADRVTALEVASANVVVMSPEAVTALETRMTAEPKAKKITPKAEKKAGSVKTEKAKLAKVEVKKVATKKPTAKKAVKPATKK
jgi:large subunit ribosomal protein L4